MFVWHWILRYQGLYGSLCLVLSCLLPRESKECFLEECPGNKRDRKTLETLIVKRIRPGTRILTDGWSGYRRLEHLG